MKKIINNRKYDTDTATEVAEWESMSDVRDFAYYTETLYRKRTGEYFLFGKGNAASKYARSCGDNSWAGGSAIIPLSYDSAREWAETHLDADDYEREFGEVSEDESTAVINAQVPASTKAALDRYCARVGRTKAEVIAELIATLA